MKVASGVPGAWVSLCPELGAPESASSRHSSLGMLGTARAVTVSCTPTSALRIRPRFFVAMVSDLERSYKTLLSVCTICGEKSKLACLCETTQYCSKACQVVDWTERGHKSVCKQLRRAAEAARAEVERANAPTPPPSPPEVVFYGPAPRSRADEERARIAAEHEAARARREANPEPGSGRFGSSCPVCQEVWDVSVPDYMLTCCCRKICWSCHEKMIGKPCPLCREPYLSHQPRDHAAHMARIKRHIQNEVPEAMEYLGLMYYKGQLGLVKSAKKAVKLFERGAELGDVACMMRLGLIYTNGAAGVKVDWKKAKKLFQVAADRGRMDAQMNLATCLLREGAKEEAFRYCKLAAEQGFTEAECALGDHYTRGDGVDFDPLEAKRWYTRAAAKGHEEAKDMLRRTEPFFNLYRH